MDSYTEFREDIGCYDYKEGIHVGKMCAAQIIGRYENLEKELGCPFDVVAKALKQRKVWNGYTYLLNMKLSYVNDTWVLSNGVHIIPVENYKSTKYDGWWLKEDKTE